MSWEYWGYPDNLNYVLAWRCFAPLYMALGAKPPARYQEYYCSPYPHGHAGGAPCPDPKQTFWRCFNDCMIRVENLIHDLMVGKTYIKPEFEGELLVVDPENYGKYIFNPEMYWSEEDYQALIGEIKAANVPNKVSSHKWFAKQYELIQLLYRKVTDPDVCFVGYSGDNIDPPPGGVSWQKLTPEGAYRHTVYRWENGAGPTEYSGSYERMRIGGASPYICSISYGIPYVEYENVFRNATGFGKACFVLAPYEDKQPFFCSTGLSEGINTVDISAAAGYTRIDGVVLVDMPMGANPEPPPESLVDEDGVEAGCRVVATAVDYFVAPLEPLNWGEDPPPEPERPDPPETKPGFSPPENDHGLIPKAAGNSIKQKLRPLIKALWSIYNRTPGIRFKVSPADPQTELDKLDKAATWGELYEPFKDLLYYRCRGNFVSPEFDGSLIDEETKKLRPAEQWSLMDGDFTGLKSIVQEFDEFYFKLANKDIIKQDEAESEAESLVDRFKTEFSRVYKRKPDNGIIHGESKGGTSLGTGAYYENTLNEAYNAAKGNSEASYATGEFCKQYVEGIPIKNDAGYVGPYAVEVQGATIYLLVESNEPIEINDVQFYATYGSEKQFKSTCGASYNELTAASADMNDILVPSTGSPSKYAKVNLCDRDNPPPLPSGDAITTTYFNGDSSWPLKQGAWGAEYECRLVDYQIKWDEFFEQT